MEIERTGGKIIYWMNDLDEELELSREKFLDLYYRGKAEMRVRPLWVALGERRYKELFTPWNACQGMFGLGTCG